MPARKNSSAPLQLKVWLFFNSVLLSQYGSVDINCGMDESEDRGIVVILAGMALLW